MNMFKDVKATTVEEYLGQVPEERKELINTLHDFIKKTVPDQKVHFAHNMIGYGSFPYVDYKKRNIEWPVIALANQKSYVSVYVCALNHSDKSQYVAEKYADQLGKVSVGKSCIRFKKIEDVNLDVLRKVIQEAAKNPGIIA